ncbi:hypothetical protein [Pseudarthrobacter sp. ATCC 49987]|uniref:hypothetical protein n=1 Tax=Pseudarthrobacter sp. ATCC 49987 TaxID=2698204 RepID=UPI00136B7A18|nr:hypothetical protein [Pseudarthrobacter sp. ATCC 49987]
MAGLDLTQATLGLAFKKAFYRATADLFAGGVDTEHVYVVFGQPSTYAPDDIVSFGRLSSGQETATIGTNRSREETLSLEVTVSCFRGGGEEAEIETAERAYELLRRIEHHVRMEDTTLGGIVRLCVLSGHESEGATPEDLIEQGRVTEVVATFTAKARIQA